MSDKKHIDRLFQEKFKDFEAVPNDAIWKNIRVKLNEAENKKPTRIRSVWWRYAGVAAFLLLLLTIGNFMFIGTENNTSSNEIIDTENSVLEPSISNAENSPSTLEDQTDSKDTSSQKTIADSDNSGVSDTESNFNLSEENSSGNNHIVVDAISNNKNNSLKKSNINTLRKTKNGNNLAVESNQVKENISSNKNVIAKNVSEGEDIGDNNSINTALQDSHKKVVGPKGDSQNILGNTKNTIADSYHKNNNTLSVDNISASVNDINEYGIYFSLFGLTASDLDLDGLVDSDLPSIEDAMVIVDDDEAIKRWSVSTKVAPVYFSNLGNGSSIDAQFNNNPKSGELNMSYGVLGGYAINDKLVIRAGVNKVDLGYNTNAVIVLQTTGKGPNSALLQNISTNNVGGQMSILSSNALRVEEVPSSLIVEEEIGLINQHIGYIEVPIELQYNLLKKKFGISVIGGFSSLFLNENELHSETGGTSTFIGEANNVNKVSYSANFGLGLNYNMSKHFNFNLEPIFKYQLNTFSNTSGNFKPYFIGVYTGISFKF